MLRLGIAHKKNYLCDTHQFGLEVFCHIIYVSLEFAGIFCSRMVWPDTKCDNTITKCLQKEKVWSAECCRAFPIFLAGFSLWYDLFLAMYKDIFFAFVDKKQIHMIWYVLTFCLAHLVAFCSEQISGAGVFIHILGRDFWAFWHIYCSKTCNKTWQYVVGT